MLSVFAVPFAASWVLLVIHAAVGESGGGTAFMALFLILVVVNAILYLVGYAIFRLLYLASTPRMNYNGD